MKLCINRQHKIHFLPSRISKTTVFTDLQEAAVQFIRQAKLAIAIDDMAAKENNLNNSLAVISELLTSFNHDGEKESTDNTSGLLDLAIQEIIEGNITNDMHSLNMADSLLMDFRNSLPESAERNDTADSFVHDESNNQTLEAVI